MRIRNRLAFLVGFALASLGFAGAVSLGMIEDPTQANQPANVTPHPSAERMAAMIDSGECWRSGGPSVIPSRVWITRNNGASFRLRGARVASQALEQISEGVNHDLTIIAFCR